MTATFVVINNSNWRELRRCLVAIQQFYPHVQILVIDHASDDESAINVQRHFPGVRLIETARNRTLTWLIRAGLNDIDAASAFVMLVRQPTGITAVFKENNSWRPLSL